MEVKMNKRNPGLSGIHVYGAELKTVYLLCAGNSNSGGSLFRITGKGGK